MLTLPFGILFAHHPGDTDDVKAEKAAIFLVAVSCCLAGLAWSAMYLFAFGPGVTAGLPLLFVLIVGSTLVVAHLRQNHVPAIYAQIASIIYITTLIQWSIGDVFGSGFVMAWAFMGPLIALMFFSIRNAIIWQILFIFNILITVLFNDFFIANGEFVTRNWQHFFFITNLGIASTVVFAFSAYFVTNALNEKKKADNLLLNILPAEIAARLKAQEEPLADTHESVSVLFADLAGFTDISRKMSADELVNLLNDLFSRFDNLAEEHGAEKIKTIGDAYMVATGLSGSVVDHAEKIADLALGMQKAFGEFRRDNKVDLKLRIGAHSGPVIAGVIGKQKFSYDLWGNTVNVASRMESEGIPDQIQISAETREMLSNSYQTSPRGEIKIKGHRPRAAYLLEGHA